MLHSPRSTYHTRLESGSLKPSDSSERLEMNFPGGFQLQDQMLGGGGSLNRLLGGWNAPSRDALSVSSPEVRGPTERRLGNPGQSQGIES